MRNKLEDLIYAIKDKCQDLMRGHYGVDELSRFMIYSALALYVLSLYLTKYPLLSLLLNLPCFPLLGISIFRAWSGNIHKRCMENLAYTRWVKGIRSRIRISKEKFLQRKDYKFFMCPNCRIHLRVPRGRGKVNITCSKCGTRFQGKT